MRLRWWAVALIVGANVVTALAAPVLGDALGFQPHALLLLPLLAGTWYLGRWPGTLLAGTSVVLFLASQRVFLGAPLAGLVMTGLFAVPTIAVAVYAAASGKVRYARSREEAAKLAVEREANAKLARRYAFLLHARQATAGATRQRELFQDLCQTAVEAGGMRFSWVGELDPSGRRVLPVARAGEGLAPTEGVALDGARGLGALLAPALLPEAVVTVADVAEDARVDPETRMEALARGPRSYAAVPIRANDATHVLILHADEPGTFDAGYAPLLRALAHHIELTLAKVRADDGRVEAERSLRESQARFQQLAESVEEIIFLTDAFGDRLLYINGAWERASGYPPEALEAGQPAWASMVSAEDAARVSACFERTRQEGVATEVDVEWRHRDGSQRCGHIRLFPVRTHDGTIFRIAGIAADTTETKARELAAARVREQEAEIGRLREIARVKAAFLNSAAHELSNPLTPIRFQIEMLQKGYAGALTREQQEAVDTLRRNLDRLSALVRDLLDAGRIEADRIVLKPAPLDLVEVLQHARSSFLPAAQHSGIDITLDVPREPVMVRGDRMRLDQTLSNLVDNALKFTPAGGHVVLALRGEGGVAKVLVRDDGVGLTPEQRARLFTPFEQVGTLSPHGRVGTGLGLYISKGLVVQHGGDIGVESDGPGKGSTFWFTLPLLHEGIPMAHEKTRPVPAERPEASA